MEKLDSEREIIEENINSYSGLKEKKLYDIMKRIFDLLFCSILFVVTSPIIFIVCILVYLQDFKNPIYVQNRVGINNREFKMYKIRSMIINAEKNGAQWANKHDIRITKLGKIIRKTRIDELPQLINVIKGEMSLIGPRPEREIFYKEFERDISNFRQRLIVKPGITGYAQVNGGYDITPKEKLDKDLYYIENRNINLDLKIVLKTVGTVLSGNGAR